MKIADLRQLNQEELYGELERLRRHLFDLRSQAVTEKLENPTLLGKTKRDIARTLTVLRELGEQNIEVQEFHRETVAQKKQKPAKAAK
ncbi:MAG: 50S ribosomal protein L29 [Phycisphaerae bacterium]|nr:50S ribosomal protein L29 [Phycisphaerae bacterium]